MIDETPSRPGRRTLLLGAVSASAVVSIRPALAQTVSSTLNCQISIPTQTTTVDDTSTTINGMILTVTASNANAVKAAYNNPGSNYLPGVSDSATNTAYVTYLQGLVQSHNNGFSCLASLNLQ